MHLMDANAWCNDCSWKTAGKNSMGNASLHYKRTLHTVHVELHYSQGNISTDKEKSVQPELTQMNIDINGGKDETIGNSY